MYFDFYIPLVLKSLSRNLYAKIRVVTYYWGSYITNAWFDPDKFYYLNNYDVWHSMIVKLYANL